MKKRFVLLLLTVATAVASSEDHYIAVSLKQALSHHASGAASLATDPAYNLNWLTTPVALLYDPAERDVILLGRREANAYNLTLDEVKLSRDNAAAREVGQSAGISIEPPKKEGEYDYDSPRYITRYLGRGVATGRPGHFFVEADLLFKMQGLGFEPLGLPGVPTEWDLLQHAARKPFASERYLDAGRYYYYPGKASVRQDAEGVSLQVLRLNIGTQRLNDDAAAVSPFRGGKLSPAAQEALATKINSEALKHAKTVTEVRALVAHAIAELAPTFPELTAQRSRLEREEVSLYRARRRELRNLDQSSADQYLSKYESSMEAFADGLDKNMDYLLHHQPSIGYFRSFVAFVALWRGTEGAALPETLLAELDAYAPAAYTNPTSVPKLRRRVDGLTYSIESGGLTSSFADWAEAKAEKPSGLLHLALDFRPNADAVAWSVPVNYSGVSYPTKQEWIAALAREDTVELDAFRAALAKTGPAVSVALDATGHWRDWPSQDAPNTPTDTPDWHPSTAGNQMAEITGNLLLGTDNGAGYSNQFLYAYVTPPTEVLGVSYVFDLNYTYHNRIKLGLTDSVTCRYMSFPDITPANGFNKHPVALPGLVDFGLVSGVTNPEVYALAMLTPDAGPTPEILFEARYVTPFYYETSNSSNLHTVFGLDGHRLSGALTVMHRLTPRLKLGAFGVVGQIDAVDAYSIANRSGFETIGASAEYGLSLRKAKMVVQLQPSFTRIGSNHFYGLDLATFAPASPDLKTALGIYKYPTGMFWFYSLSIPWQRASFRLRQWF